jgi:hypothetical protein
MHLKIEDESKFTKKITKRNNQIYQPITNLSIKETKNNEIKLEDNNKIPIIKLFFEIIALPYLLIGRHLYIISLKGCNKSEYDCLFDIQYIIDDINNCVQSTFYFIFVLFLIQMNLCSKYYLIVIFAFFAEFIIADRGSTFLNHGILNILGFFVILSFGEIIILIIVLFYKLYRCKNRIPFFFSVIIFSIFTSIFIFKNKDNFFCKDWDKGLNNTYIENNSSKYPCKMKIPKSKCLINIVRPFLDASKFAGIKCEKRQEKEKYLLKNFLNYANNTHIKRIGYPITIGKNPEIVGKPAMYSGTLLEFVKNNLINMDDKEQLNKLEDYQKPEVIVDFNKDPYGQIQIKINYNESLAKERQLKQKNETKNVLFIYMDNLSRNHFYRQYPKTCKFLEKFLSYKGFSPSNKNNSNENYHGFEFLKYYKFEGATLSNALPMFSGVNFDPHLNMVSIVREFKNNGYVTANIQDICHKELMDINPLEKYVYVEFDHEYAAPNCDPNIYTFGYSFSGGENGIFRKCQYGKESFEHPLEYAKKFWKSYKDCKKFMRIVNTYAHEYSGEKSKYSDEPLRDFLKYLYESSQLNDTTVFIAGDHGFALMGVYKILEANDWKAENDLPVFFIIEPDNTNLDYEKQYQEISKNQQTLITAFDIFYTLKWILYGEEYKSLPLNGDKNSGECLFKYINPKLRNCKKYKKLAKSTCYC